MSPGTTVRRRGGFGSTARIAPNAPCRGSARNRRQAAQTAVNTGQPAFNHLLQVLEQVPPISHLNCVGSAQGTAAGILGGTVAGGHRDRVTVVEPLRQRLGGAVRQQINHTVRPQINQDSAVAPPFPQRPIIHAQHAGQRVLRQGKARTNRSTVSALLDIPSQRSSRALASPSRGQPPDTASLQRWAGR